MRKAYFLILVAPTTYKALNKYFREIFGELKNELTKSIPIFILT